MNYKWWMYEWNYLNTKDRLINETTNDEWMNEN